jgi:hypothetical protein
MREDLISSCFGLQLPVMQMPGFVSATDEQQKGHYLGSNPCSNAAQA